MSYFLYKRKRGRWLTLYSKVLGSTEQPPKFESGYLTRKVDINFEAVSGSLPEMALKLNEPPFYTKLLYRSLCLITAMFSLGLLVNETALVFSANDMISLLLHDW